MSDDVGSRRFLGFTAERPCDGRASSRARQCAANVRQRCLVLWKIAHCRSLHVIYTHRFIYKLLCIPPWAIHNTSAHQYMLNTIMHTVHYIMHVIAQVHLQRIIEKYNCMLWVTANPWSYRIVFIAKHHCTIDRRCVEHTQIFNHSTYKRICIRTKVY